MKKWTSEKQNPHWPKCPKCKSQRVRIVELWSGHSITWEPDSFEDEGVLDEGSPHHVEGECLNCEHTWRLRHISQVQQRWWEPE